MLLHRLHSVLLICCSLMKMVVVCILKQFFWGWSFFIFNFFHFSLVYLWKIKKNSCGKKNGEIAEYGLILEHFKSKKSCSFFDVNNPSFKCKEKTNLILSTQPYCGYVCDKCSKKKIKNVSKNKVDKVNEKQEKQKKRKENEKRDKLNGIIKPRKKRKPNPNNIQLVQGKIPSTQVISSQNNSQISSSPKKKRGRPKKINWMVYFLQKKYIIFFFLTPKSFCCSKLQNKVFPFVLNNYNL